MQTIALDRVVEHAREQCAAQLFLHYRVARTGLDGRGAVRIALVPGLDEHDDRHLGHFHARAHEQIHRGVERPREIEQHDVDALIGEARERFVAEPDGREREGREPRRHGRRERRAQQARGRRVAGNEQGCDRLEIHCSPRGTRHAERVPVRNDGAVRAGVTRRCRERQLGASFDNGRPPIALTIAGSDSGGGAGIQADLKTFQHFGVFGTSVITAVTAQNTRGVAGWLAMPVSMIESQIDAVAGDLRPAATKTGMLADACDRGGRCGGDSSTCARAARGGSRDGRGVWRPAARERRGVRAARAAHSTRDARHAESRRGGDSRGRDGARRRCDGARGARARGARSDGRADQGRAFRGRRGDRRARARRSRAQLHAPAARDAGTRTARAAPFRPRSPR